jgi:hypothetical protein
LIHGRTSIHIPVMTIKASGKSGTYTTGWGESGSPVKEKYAGGGMVSREQHRQDAVHAPPAVHVRPPPS